MKRGQDFFFPIPNHCLILSMMLMQRSLRPPEQLDFRNAKEASQMLPRRAFPLPRGRHIPRVKPASRVVPAGPVTETIDRPPTALLCPITQLGARSAQARPEQLKRAGRAAS
jgi:hypothetical protein